MNPFVLILDSVWQGAAITAVMWMVLRSMPRLNAATRYVLWWAALLFVVSLPLASLIAPQHTVVFHSLVASASGAPAYVLLPEVPPPAVVTLDASRWSPLPLVLGVIWCALFLYALMQIGSSWRYLRGIKMRATPSARSLTSVGRAARLLFSAEVSAPMAVGFVEPAVILPASLPAELESTELEHVLLHESAHLARFDDWTNLVAQVLTGALALHPVALWILWQIEREREIACDEWVVARTGRAREYAGSLARMCERRPSHEPRLATGLFGRPSKMVRRIALLVQPGRSFSSALAVRRIIWSCAALCGLWAATSRVPHLIAFAQQASRPSNASIPAFEVATVKLNTSGDGTQFIERQPGGRIKVSNFPLRQLIAWAYQLAPSQLVGGPSWITSARFDMAAKLEGNPEFPPPGAVGPNPIQLAMRTLLSDRFQLKVHRGSREMDVYALVMEKPGVPGPALKPSSADCSGPVNAGPRRSAPPPNNRSSAILPCGITGVPGVIRFGGFPMSRLATTLGGQSGRTVLDRTGLAGSWEFELHFAAEVAGPLDAGVPASDPEAPSLFTALQEQLGLKLESTKGAVDVVIIDSVDQLTSE